MTDPLKSTRPGRVYHRQGPPPPKSRAELDELQARLTAKRTPRPDPEALRIEVPGAMREARRWLLWREGPVNGQGKPSKLPYYSDGTPRRGTLDSAEDSARLVDLETALGELAKDTRWAGVGFALGPAGDGHHWQGIDLDGTDTRPELRALVELLPGYVERSPSGKGYHAIGIGRPFEALAANASGVEAYASGRYFTVTGDAIGGDLEDLSPFVADTLGPRHRGAEKPAERPSEASAGAPIKDGARDQTLTSLAGSMRRRGMTEAEILAALTAINAGRCKPPLDDAQVAKIARSVGRYEPAEDYAAGAETPKPDAWPLIWLSEARARVSEAALIRGLIKPGSMVVTYGESNSGKTFAVLDRDLCLCMGRAWYGRETAGGFVLYVAGEGAHSVENRVTAYRDRFMAEDTGAPFAILPLPLNLLNASADTGPLIEFIKKHEDARGVGCAKVTVDTLARAMAGGNENAAEDMGAVVANADRIRAAVGCAVEFVHHTGKDTARGARGHSSLRAATDTEIEVVARDGLHVARVTKQRDLDTLGQEFAFTLHVVELGRDPYGHPVTTCVPEWARGAPAGRRARLSRAESALLAIVEEVARQDRTLPPAACSEAIRPPRPGQFACPVERLREEVAKRGGITASDKPDSLRRAFVRALHGLRDRGIVEVFADWAWLADKSDKSGQNGFCPQGSRTTDRTDTDNPL